MSAWQVAESFGQLGCRVDTSPAQRSIIPHRDALIIVDQVAGLLGNVAIDLREETLLGHLAPLAVDIANPRYSLSEADVVETYARAGVSPDWCRQPPKARPLIRSTGKPAVEGKRYGKDRYSDGANCPLRWGDPTIESIARARAQYSVWWRSLDRLAKSLNGKMKDHVASPPAALASPWMRPH